MDFKEKHKLFANGFAKGPWHSQTNNIRFKFFANPIKNGITLGILAGIVMGGIAIVGVAVLFFLPPSILSHFFGIDFAVYIYFITTMVVFTTVVIASIIVGGIFGACCSIAMRSKAGFQKIKIEKV